MGTYLERYLAGEHREVTSRLGELGEEVREPSVVEDAWAVAREIAGRIESNLKLLYRRLTKVGYEFAHPDRALCSATAQQESRLDAFEEDVGMLPMTVRAFYETLESVDFEQSESQLRGEVGPDAVQGLGSHPQMCIKSLDAARQGGRSEPGGSDGLVRLPVGPLLSNCDTATVRCPNPGFDELEFAMDGRNDSSFIEFFRDCLSAGGFPFWAHTGGMLPDILVPAQPEYQQLLPELTEGFQSF